MKDQYVLLTGGKNNAGDFLIKYRAKELFAALRPDRKIIDFDAWKPFTPEQLKTVNESKALILTGGPALQNKMRPNIYPMVRNLEEIKVPIIMMAVGWKSADGSLEAADRYLLSDETKILLQRIDKSGYKSSVRDFHTERVLTNLKLKNVKMTGCAALFSLEHISMPCRICDLKKISFSLGVAFVESQSMERSVKTVILKLKGYFKHADFKVVFHHSTNKEAFLKTHNAKTAFADKQEEFIKWLEEHKIGYVDISGSEKTLIEHYQDVDLHIGYRVHAHIFMSSISKPSILITEDGRGEALRDVINGIILSGYTFEPFPDTFRAKVKRKFGHKHEYFKANPDLPEELIAVLDAEIKSNYVKINQIRPKIDAHFNAMKDFIKQLP